MKMKTVYMVVVNEYGDEDSITIAEKVFTNKETAELKKDALLNMFHDIQANVVDLRVDES